jgi:hypothetical protein
MIGLNQSFGHDGATLVASQLSSPGLSRGTTSASLPETFKPRPDVDGRDKPGHDVERYGAASCADHIRCSAKAA